MGDPRGFLKVKRQAAEYRPVCERIQDYREVTVMRSPQQAQQQASRCMDCGTAFCHWACALGNYIPEWNDLFCRKNWPEAFLLLAATNNFPEITARVCPAACEYACVLGINDDPVTIRENELAVIETAFAAGLVRPRLATKKTGKKIAIVGSGPAGLACADQLSQAGHAVTVFEKQDKIGGLLRYGMPDFKLEKNIIDRRLSLLKQQGISFITKVTVGIDYRATNLLADYEAVCLAGGSAVPRDLVIPGRELTGIYFALDYLVQANKMVAGEKIGQRDLIDARDKNVVVIGGGDTGSDCVGTANRQGARCVVQIELLAQPPEYRQEDSPWPQYPLLLKTSSSHQEGVVRQWAVLTKEFSGSKGRLKKLSCVRVEFTREKNGVPLRMREITGSNFELEADLVILAMGFLHPEPKGLLTELGVILDERGNVLADNNYMTSQQKIFTAGDMHSGQSLVVRAMAEGRRAAYGIDKYLMGGSDLPYI